MEEEPFSLEVSVLIKNTGLVTGSEVVQLYISYPDVGLVTPTLQLKAFGKAKELAPGSAKKLTMKLDKYAVSFWDSEESVWRAARGKYGVHAGPNSENLQLHGNFELRNPFSWKGL